MRNVRAIATGGMVLLLLSLPALSAESDLDAKTAKLFKIKWGSISYYKTATIGNPDASSSMQTYQSGQQNQENLTLSIQAAISDPNRILGTIQEGVITQVTDGAGRDVNIVSAPPQPHQTYMAPHYRQHFTQPPQVPKWQAFVQSVLRLPSQSAGFRPQLVTELQPCQISLHLDLALLKQSGGEIRRVKGYFYALMPGSLESIDVPFEPNSTWVQLTPDTAIQVREATCTGGSYHYSVQSSQPGGSRPLNLGASLPNRFVVEQQLIGAEGKPVNRPMGGMFLGGHIGGNGSGSGSFGQIKAFRFIIAVNPSHKKIPFELEHIPLPKP
jgi:hypothetical protein